MLEARTLEWTAGLAKLAGSALDDRAIAIRDIAALFGEFMPVREKWLHLVRNVEKRIALPSTRYVVVTGPSGSSLDDAAYLIGQLRERSLAGMVPKKTPLCALPALKTSDPREILVTLAGELSGSALVGG